jgi:hypothetical protein
MTFELTEDERILIQALLTSYTKKVLVLQQAEVDPTATAETLDVASKLFKKLSSAP